MEIKQLIGLLTVFWIASCGHEDPNSLKGVFEYQEGEFYALAYDSNNDSFRRVVCEDTSVLLSMAECSQQRLLRDFGNRDSFLNHIVKLLQTNFFSLSGDLAYHVKVSSSVLMSGELERLSNEQQSLQKQVRELKEKIDFLRKNGYAIEDTEEKLQDFDERLRKVNDRLGEIHPSSDTLLRIINRFIDAVRKDDFLSRNLVTDKSSAIIYDLITSTSEPALSAEDAVFDPTTGYVWRTYSSLVKWTEVRTGSAKLSCENLYGPMWHSPSYNSYVTVVPTRIFVKNNTAETFANLSIYNVILDWIPPEYRSQSRTLVCLASIQEVNPYGDIDADGTTNANDCSYSYIMDKGEHEKDWRLPQGVCASSKSQALDHYGVDPFREGPDLLPTFSQIKKGSGSGDYHFLRSQAPKTIDEAKELCRSIGAKLGTTGHSTDFNFSPMPPISHMFRRQDNMAWTNRGIASKYFGQNQMIFSSMSGSARSNDLSIVVAWLNPRGPNKVDTFAQIYNDDGRPWGKVAWSTALVWTTCNNQETHYALDSSDLDLDNIPNSKDRCLNDMSNLRPVDQNGCTDGAIPSNHLQFTLRDINPVAVTDEVTEVSDDVSKEVPKGPASGQSSLVMRCLEDYEKIRNEWQSGICLNTSSNFCYRFSEGEVDYSSGPVECPK